MEKIYIYIYTYLCTKTAKRKENGNSHASSFYKKEQSVVESDANKGAVEVGASLEKIHEIGLNAPKRQKAFDFCFCPIKIKSFFFY